MTPNASPKITPRAARVAAPLRASAPLTLTQPSGVSIRGDRHVSWGAAGLFTWTSGGITYTAAIVKSGRATTDGEETTVAGSVGNTVDHILFDDRTEAEVEITWRDNEVYPSRRDVATVCGKAAFVTKVENTWEQKNVRGCRVTVKGYAGVNYGVSPEGSSSSASESSASESSAS
ncbi:MAG: hypothetical protein PHI35_00630 [Victivallaceae bacterium]|nr:hypothetical protein [Victivallaceae bacterium]